MYILPFMLFARFPRLGRRGQTKLVTSRDSPHVPTEPRLTFTRLFPHRTGPRQASLWEYNTRPTPTVQCLFILVSLSGGYNTTLSPHSQS